MAQTPGGPPANFFNDAAMNYTADATCVDPAASLVSDFASHFSLQTIAAGMAAPRVPGSAASVNDCLATVSTPAGVAIGTPIPMSMPMCDGLGGALPFGTPVAYSRAGLDNQARDASKT